MSSLPKATAPRVRQLRKQLLDFIQQEAKLARDGERLLGTSDVLESIIGRFKYIAGERGQHGMTGMVLSVAAMVGSHMIDTVAAALTEITNQDVWQWCQAHLGPTVQSVRRRITAAVQTEQKRQPLRLETG